MSLEEKAQNPTEGDITIDLLIPSLDKSCFKLMTERSLSRENFYTDGT